ncbi:hypothetical protein AE929_05350 [Xanthomonas arboricola]|nr:hypothetical protein AKJ12_00335 [Xanthomonas arboricola pv. juglandis]KOA98735.1 hypothetical protein AE920_14240 [Xanthomonas arboricola]KOB09761.1 hypothetical protein AE923_08115 [Xanthomonas arboricola]KOB18839.1 hypothetical protein AE925_10975 [Xanthomonas arboricola]KOB30700.1 hypothetical protein AE928_14195 [Xanthomonas arboricola]
MKRRWLGMLVVSVMVNAVASNIIANAFICLLLQWMEPSVESGLEHAHLSMTCDHGGGPAVALQDEWFGFCLSGARSLGRGWMSPCPPRQSAYIPLFCRGLLQRQIQPVEKPHQLPVSKSG